MKKYKPNYVLAFATAVFEISLWAICCFLPMTCISASSHGFFSSLLFVSAPFLILAFAFFVILAVLNLIIGIFQKPHVYIDGEKIIFGKSEIDGRRIDTIKMDFGTWVYRGTVQSAKITLFCGLCETEIKHPSIALLFALMKVCKNAKIKTGLIKRLVISSLCFVFLGLVLACVFMK